MFVLQKNIERNKKMKALEYPFDSEYILKKKKSIKRELLAEKESRIHKNFAILGGSTTADVLQILELFLLNYGIEISAYESEYNRFFEDAVFGNPQFDSFEADVIYIHTGIHNILRFPNMGMSKEEVDGLLDAEFSRFEKVWESLAQKKNCIIIQNNFELPEYRLLGNKDGSDFHGRVNYINRLNQRFADYADKTENLFLNDVNYLSARVGLDKWCDSFYWNMYKYCPAVPVIPELCFQVANIIKSVYGKNKKALVLDLDNTLWGGVVGDDGPENLKIGSETAVGETFSAFQQYLKEQKSIGVLLNIDSKNDYENAIAGLNAKGSVLTPDDFIAIKANWNPKDQNLKEIAKELNLGEEAFVFVDDNPAERLIVSEQLKGVSVPEMTKPEDFIKIIDRSGFFEVTNISADDASRNEMYKANAKRTELEASFSDYREYLLSLEMKAEIKPFSPEYMPRISQLSNKSNQFNLTTLRCSVADIEEMAADEHWITLYGKLEDRFGDNGLVAVQAAEILPDAATLLGREAHIRLNLMSCRVLKRNMEFAMLDELVRLAKEKGVTTLVGHYLPTKKNGMVADLYTELGFEKKDDIWLLDIESYEPQCHEIIIN